MVATGAKIGGSEPNTEPATAEWVLRRDVNLSKMTCIKRVALPEVSDIHGFDAHWICKKPVLACLRATALGYAASVTHIYTSRELP